MTLPEVLMASVFALLLTGSVFAFANFLNYSKWEYAANLELSNDARVILEKMVFGAKQAGQVNRRGVIEAVSGTINSTTQFTYVDMSGVQHSLRLNNGNIEYQPGVNAAWTTLLDPNGAAAYDPTSYTTSLRFLQPANPNSVQVQVVVGKRQKTSGRWNYGSASTQVFFRNV